MIKVELFDYITYDSIDMKVTKYINENLECIIRVFIDMLEDACDFDKNAIDYMIPRTFLTNNPDEGKKLIYELNAIISSDTLREFIKPKYEFLLYAILSWWEGIVNDGTELIPNEIDAALLSEIKGNSKYYDEDGNNFVLEAITDFDDYYSFLFQDLDFLPDAVESITNAYISNPLLYVYNFSDVNLDDYIDLMPADLRELYIEKKSQSLITQNHIRENNNIVKEFSACLDLLEQRVVEIFNRNEVEISNDIYSIMVRILNIKYDIILSREATIGRANKMLGETDLYAYKQTKEVKEEYFILENKYLHNFLQQYKQLLGYLNKNFRFGITLSINKDKPFREAVTYVHNKLLSIQNEEPQFIIVNVSEPLYEHHGLIISSHIIPELPDKYMDIYHLILNLYDPERKEIATAARK